MDVGVVKVAEDSDFEKLKSLIDNNDDWKLDYSKGETNVWTKAASNTDFKMVKISTVYPDVTPQQLYDTLHDPEYRKVWDNHMIEAFDIGYLNPNNDIGYYSMSCPPPLKNRDFILQRSWLDTGEEQLIVNHSVFHRDYPAKSNYVRAISYITGFVIRSDGASGCSLGYVSQTDPKGTLPSWLVNKVTQIFAPKCVPVEEVQLAIEEVKSPVPVSPKMAAKKGNSIEV
ncbi:hypothetical protein B566_EDAN013842 [Ephemera danica]|nr:hypothetical protein B566_EDAN013842 [Ephemera danica]